MALRDHTTPTAIRAVVAGVPSDVRMDALRGANPGMYAEVQRVSQTPRLCRELTVETVVELINWLSDPAAISQIVAGDTRDAVTRAAKSRLRELDAPPPPSTNLRNINTRTQRALDKTNVVEALQQIGNGNVGWQLVGEWFCELPTHRREGLVIDLAKVAASDPSNPDAHAFLALLTIRSFTHQDRVEPVTLLRNTKIHAAGVLALRAVTDVITAPVAEYIADGGFSAHMVHAPSIDDAATRTLERAHRFDVLVALEAVEPDVIVAGMAHARMHLSDRATVVHHAKSARYVDALAPLLGTIDRAAVPAAAALAVTGISTESRAILLATATPMDVVSVFAGELGDLPSQEEVVAFAQRSHTGHVASTRELVTTLARNYESGTPALIGFVQTMWEHSTEMLSTVMNLSWRADWVIETCMAATAASFNDLPDAWGVFFTAAKNRASGSAGDLIRAVALTQ